MAEFKLSRIRYTWKGNWSSGTDYIPDDIVSYGGKAYVCVVQHTASSEIYTDINFVNTDVPPVNIPRWELMIDGNVWKGVWSPNTYYDVNDIIKYNGITYKCITKHVSIDTDSTSQEEFENDQIYWETYVDGYDWRAAWQPSTYYRLNDVIKHGGNVYKCIQEHTSLETTNIGLEPDSSKWEVITLSDRWRGNWDFNTKYIENDVVRYGTIVYRCVTAHVSRENQLNIIDEDIFDSEFETDLAKWEIVHSGIQYRGTWSSETFVYRVNDLVKFGGSLWIAGETHTPAAEFEVDKWVLYSPGFQYENLWNPTEGYQPGDVVRYGGYIYKSLSKNVGLIPTQETNDWILIQAGVNLRGEWRLLDNYRVGDVVRRKGQLYTAIADSVSSEPNTNINDWELTVPGESWSNFWQYPVVYLVGEVVSYAGTTYRCIQKHTSSNANRPDKDISNTNWTLYIQGTVGNVLSQRGDIKTFDLAEDEVTIEKVRVSLGTAGTTLRVAESSVSWAQFNESDGVYFVGTDGIDDSHHGKTLQNPWRTVRYACENITGPATIFVKHGEYEEILPIKVPAFVAIVGDELRGTVIKPALDVIPQADVSVTSTTLNRIKIVLQSLLLGQTVVSNVDFPQEFPDTPVTSIEYGIIASLIDDHVAALLGDRKSVV